MPRSTDYAALSTPTAGLGIVLPDAWEPPHPTEPALILRDSRARSTHVRHEGDAGTADLVDVTDRFVCVNCYWQAGWPGTDDRTWLRADVADLLAVAERALPRRFGIAIFDAWRSMETVRALYAHFYGPGSTLAPGFLADPDAPGAVPPHTTGAVVDLTLTWDGTPLSLGTPFDDFTERAAAGALEHATDPDDLLDRDLRRLLRATLVAHGFAPYEPEWWHYELAAPRAPVAAPGSVTP